MLVASRACAASPFAVNRGPLTGAPAVIAFRSGCIRTRGRPNGPGSQAGSRRPGVVRVAATATTEAGTRGSCPVLVAIEVPACRLQFGEHLRLVGSCEELGAWDATAAPVLEWQEGDSWVAELAVPVGEHSFKLVVMRADGSNYWEDGDNRVLLVPVAAAPSGLPVLRATCRFGTTTDTSVAELTCPWEEAAAASSCEPVHSVAVNSPVPEELEPVAAEELEGSSSINFPEHVNAASLDGTAPAPEAAVQPKGSLAAAAVEEQAPAASISTLIAQTNGPGVKEIAQELAEAEKERKAATATTAAAAANPAEPATSALTANKAAEPVPSASSVAAPAAIATAPVTRGLSPGLLFPVLPPLCAGILYVGAAALNVVPSLEVPAGNAADVSSWTSGVMAALAAVQQTLAGLFAAFQGSSADAQKSAADSLTVLQSGAADSLAAFQLSATDNLAALQKSVAELSSCIDVSGLSGSVASTLGSLEKSGEQLLAAFQASSGDVLSNLRANSTTLQDSLGTGLSALEASSEAALSAAQASSAEASASLQKSLADMDTRKVEIPSIDTFALTLPR